MLSESSLQRAMPIGVSCLLHAGLIVGLLSIQPWAISVGAISVGAVGVVAVRPPVLPVELVTLDAPEPPREPSPVPPRRERAIPPRRPEPPRPREESAVARTEEPAPPTGPPVPAPAPAPAERAPAPPAMAAPPAISEPDRAPEASPPVASSSPLAGAPLTTAPPTRPSPEEGERVAKAPSSPAEDVTRAARPRGGYQVRPAYPSTPRRLGIQGTTLLRVHVLADGRIGDVLIARSAGHADLDQAAVEAVRRWRFDPARRGDDPVAMWVLLPVEFRLKR